MTKTFVISISSEDEFPLIILQCEIARISCVRNSEKEASRYFNQGRTGDPTLLFKEEEEVICSP